MGRFEQIKAWQLAHQLLLRTYAISKNYPADERYGLTAQTRRAAYSVAANIAEGTGRRGPREFRRFLDMANGSLVELRYAFLAARDLGYLPSEEWTAINDQRDEVGRVLWALYREVSLNAGPSRPS